MNCYHRFLLMLLCACCVTTISGCGGCRSEEDVETQRKKAVKEKEKKPTPNFVSPGTAIMPGIFPKRRALSKKEIENLPPIERSLYRSESFLSRNRTKAGHWVTTATPVIANNFDVRGRVELANVVPGGRQSPAIDGTDFSIVNARPFSLSKGQWKTLQSTAYLVPRRDAASVNLKLDFLPASGSMPVFTAPMCVSRLMKGFQYHMMLLTNRPQKMRYLKLTDSVRINDTDTYADGRLPESYFVVENTPGMPLPLSANALQWTTIAYVVWDDLDPNDLELDQQQALIDWLHFGGQLIISGPDSLAKLENSFLSDYLPAQSQQRIELEKSAFGALNRFWSIADSRNTAATRRLTIVDGEPIVGVEFKPHVSAAFIQGTGDLVIERRVGRGRVVATAFSLAHPSIRSWPSFQTFFSGGLLRRPARKFGRNSADVLSYRWARRAESIFDPLIGSAVRFTSRDLGTGSRGAHPPTGTDESSEDISADDVPLTLETRRGLPNDGGSNQTSSDQRFEGYHADSQSGVAAWSDDSAIANAARRTLKSAAGITPPSANLVLKLLGAYLFVLVPLNWIVFRMLGKVEWAWMMVPLISIAGAFAVVRMASLDIGFARSNVQVGLLELHADYPRGHLSQFSALYTSLSTKYDVELDNATGIALPFSSGDYSKKQERVIAPVTLHQSIVNRLEGFLIRSNSTRLMHTECLVDCGGGFLLTGAAQGFGTEVAGARNLQLDNTTSLNLHSAAIIARDKDGQFYHCQLGTLAAGAAESVVLTACQASDYVDLWDLDPSVKEAVEGAILESAAAEVTASAPVGAHVSAAVGTSVSASRLMEKVVSNLTLGPGEVRLLGYCDEAVGQTRFVPESTQTRQQTLVLVHLRPAILPLVERDENSVLDFLARRVISAEADSDDVIAGEMFDGTDNDGTDNDGAGE